MSQPHAATASAPMIGDYRILSKIGRGGLAEVYKALQMSLQREVAIKILSPDYTYDSDIVKRFERESMLIAKLNHPNIVHVIDKGVRGGRYYFVMEYVEGTNFKQVIRNADVDLTSKIEIVVQVCKALDFAHNNGVVHRDIKPANILIDREGNAKVADFGIAQLHDSPDCELTSADVVMGTVAYMSPEQKLSSAQVTRTSDIYALGIILYEICCGKKPEGHFKRPSEINLELPAKLDDIIIRCLSEAPGDRYPTAGALKDDLLNAFGGNIYSSARADSAIARVESFMGKCQFLETIKENRFGATYLVENKEAKKLYIIKKNNQGEVGLKEARILSSLRHEHIIEILGAGGDRRKSVIVTEYASHGSLGDRLVKPYGWKEAMAIVLQIADGLEFAHKNNVIHGDLRPSNVLFDENDTVKVTDFGQPPHYDAHKDWFAPPERKHSKPGDIYSLGVIAFMLMTNKLPSHDREGNPQLAALDLVVPRPIHDILKKMLMLRAAKRYQTVQEILDDHADYVASLEQSRVRSQAPTPASQRNRSYALALLVAVAGLAGVLLALFWDRLF